MLTRSTYEESSKNNARYFVSQQLLVVLLFSFGLPFEIFPTYLNTAFQRLDPFFEAVLVLFNR
jgi:hypothetical protein